MDTKVGSEAMIGDEGRALEEIGPDRGRIFIDGEYWKARTNGAVISKDQICTIVKRKGLTLIVEPNQPKNNGDSS